MKPTVEKSLLADLAAQLERMRIERDAAILVARQAAAERDEVRAQLGSDLRIDYLLRQCNSYIGERDEARALNRELERALGRVKTVAKLLPPQLVLEINTVLGRSLL